MPTMMVSNPQDGASPLYIPVNVNNKKQTRVVAATSAPKSSSSSRSSTAHTASTSGSGGSRGNAGGIGVGGGRDDGDENDGQDNDGQKNDRDDGVDAARSMQRMFANMNNANFGANGRA